MKQSNTVIILEDDIFKLVRLKDNKELKTFTCHDDAVEFFLSLPVK